MAEATGLPTERGELLDSKTISGAGSFVTRIGFGGGCHWCTEAVFDSLEGVHQVQQGFARSHPPADQYSEAVLVNFDDERLPLEVLIEVHLRTHSSTSAHAMRVKYRSAIYVFATPMIDACQIVLERLQGDFDRRLVTQVLELVNFELSAERYHNYYYSDPERPFCTTYIEPKIELLKQRYSALLKPE